MGILIVEKNNESSELIFEILNQEIVDLYFVSNGEQALVAFRKYKISVLIIDLEIQLVNAFELIQIIKTENPQIKIIALKSATNDYKNIYQGDIVINKEDISKYLYSSYIKLINNKEKLEMKDTFQLSTHNLADSLENLMIFEKAFKSNNLINKTKFGE